MADQRKNKEYQRTRNWLTLANLCLTLFVLLSVIYLGLSQRFYDWASASLSQRYGALFLYFLIFSIYSMALTFPFSVYSGFHLEHRYALSNQKFRSWFQEWSKKQVLSFAIVTPLVLALYALIWKFPETWWVTAWAGYAVFSFVLGKLFPILIVPIFYKYSRLADNQLKSRIEALAKRFGFEIQNVFSLNLSKTTKKANAMFTGMGKSKRVVLADTLLHSFSHDEIETVVAHELGHCKYQHIWKSLGFGLVVSLIGFWIAFHTLHGFSVALGFSGAGDVRAFPALCLIFFLFQLVLMPLANAYSRRAERQADQFALEATQNRKAFTSAMQKLSDQNLADPEPHPLIEFLLYDHPSIGKRIRSAVILSEEKDLGQGDSSASDLRMTLLLFGVFLFAMVPSACAKQADLSSLVKKGEVLVDQGAYPAGIAVFETVLAKEPENGKAISEYIKACEVYSRKLIEQGRHKQATTYVRKMNDMLERIDSVPPDEMRNENERMEARIKRERAGIESAIYGNDVAKAKEVAQMGAGREIFNLGVEQFKKAEYELAEKSFLEALKYDPANPLAYQLLGEVANLRQDLEKSEEYLKKALELNPDPKIRQKLERVRREKTLDKNQQDYADEHFVIRYQRSGKFEGARIRAYLRAAYRDISQEFGFYPNNKITVTLYGRDEFEALYGEIPHWSGAMYDGKLRLPAYEEDFSRAELRKFIFHELAHGFIGMMSKLKCPIWLNEGLGQYFENKIQKIPTILLEIKTRENKLLGINEMLYGDASQMSSTEDVTLYYLQSFSLVGKMIDDFGMYKMKLFLVELGENIPMEEAFEKVYGRTFGDFSSKWRSEINQKYGS